MSFGSSIAKLFRSFFTGLFQRHGQSFLDTALALAVGFASTLVDSNISGAEKKAIVKQQLTSALAVQGKAIASHELNLLIEMAVSKVKSDKLTVNT